MNNSKAFSKQNILFFVVAILNFIVCTFLTLTCIPGEIPLHISLTEKITLLGSKWWLSINIVLPLILTILMMVFHKKDFAVFTFKALFVLMIYENLLAYSYFALATNLTVGALTEVPLAASSFIPASVILSVLAIKIKHIPYKSKFMGIRTKYTKADEFIWKQTHFFARDVFFATGVIFFFVSIPFLFIRLAYIPTALFLIAIVIDIIIVNHQSKLMYNKLVDMQKRKERMEAKKKPAETAENQETKPEKTAEEKTEEKSQENQNKTTKK